MTAHRPSVQVFKVDKSNMHRSLRSYSVLARWTPSLQCSKWYDCYTQKEFINCTRFSHPISRNFANGTMLG